MKDEIMYKILRKRLQFREKRTLYDLLSNLEQLVDDLLVEDSL